MKKDKVVLKPALENERIIELELVNELLKDLNTLNESDAFYYLWAIKSIQNQATGGIKFKDFAVVSTAFFNRAMYRDSAYFVEELIQLKKELENLCGDSYTLKKHQKCFQILDNMIDMLEFEFKENYETRET